MKCLFCVGFLIGFGKEIPGFDASFYVIGWI